MLIDYLAVENLVVSQSVCNCWTLWWFEGGFYTLSLARLGRFCFFLFILFSVGDSLRDSRLHPTELWWPLKVISGWSEVGPGEGDNSLFQRVRYPRTKVNEYHPTSGLMQILHFDCLRYYRSISNNRRLWAGACNSNLFLSRRFHRPIYF